MDINDIIPARGWYQGDTISFPVILTDYDPTLWTLTYVLLGQGLPKTTFSSTPGADGTFLMAVAKTVTALWTPGTYYLTAYVTKVSDGTRVTLGQVEGTIWADLSVLAGDPRSDNRKAFDDVEAALAAGAGSDVTEYTIAGTSMKKDRAGLLALRAFYLVRVRAEQGKPAIGNILYSL
jgi:hypothetical protein